MTKMDSSNEQSEYRTQDVYFTNKPKLTHNRAKCLKCGSIVESMHRHDFVSCKCGAMAVDGGLDYERRLGNAEEIEELSTYA